MNLGFIGTGNIVTDVITGVCKSKISYKKIFISPRNKKKAQNLKKKFKKIIIAKDNQTVVTKSDWIFLGVLPQVGENILPKLNFKKKQIVISFMSTTNFSKLKKSFYCLFLVNWLSPIQTIVEHLYFLRHSLVVDFIYVHRISDKLHNLGWVFIPLISYNL